jgi:hypothetical protein
MKEIRSLAIWLLNNTYYLQAHSVSVDGIYYSASNPIHIINQSEEYKLGNEILETLKECRFGIPNPPLDNTDRKQFHALLGVKTEKELMKKGKSLYLTLKEKINIYPLYFDGKAMSRHTPPEECSLNPEDITKTVLEAFERCHP